MKKLLLAGCLFASSYLSAQTLADKTDPFTGKKSKSAVVFIGRKVMGVPILGASTQSLIFNQEDGKNVLFLSWPSFDLPYTTDPKVLINSKNCSLLMKMDDDSIFRIKADTTMSTNVIYGLKYSVNVGSYVSDAQLQYLMIHKIKILRFAVNGDIGPDLEMLTDKNRSEIQKSAAYLLGMKEIPEEQN